jgi:tetrahydromethanopterin S-methyltransferase subunit A
MEETANTIPVETIDHINEVICTGSIDPYIEHVKEEIITNYRAVMKSQLYELADLASVDDSEVFAALETSETDPETPESVPTVESIEDTENTPEIVENVPTDTDTETDPGTVSDNTEIDYNSSEYVELSVITTDANGDQVVNVYSVPLNE